MQLCYPGGTDHVPAGKRARWRNLLGAPLREFYRRFVQLGGWHDGRLGLLLCGTLAFFEFIKYVHLFALQKTCNIQLLRNYHFSYCRAYAKAKELSLCGALFLLLEEERLSPA